MSDSTPNPQPPRSSGHDSGATSGIDRSAAGQPEQTRAQANGSADSQADGAVRFWRYDHFPMALPARHRYPRNRFAMLRERLLAAHTVPEARLMPAQPAEWPHLELVHGADYLRAVRQGRLSDRAMREIGLPWSPELVARARAAVGGTVRAAQDALRTGIGVVLGGGTHHAFADRGAGYCLFSDIAVAIRWLQAAGQIGQALIIDLDVHQGNGNAEIFADDPTVYTFSVHGAGNWPYRKSLSDLDIALPDGTQDADYLAAVEPALHQVLARTQPNLVFYQAGVDPLANDRLGRLALSHEGLRRRDALVLDLCAAAGLPLVVTMGGGYAAPIEDSVQAHAFTVAEVLRVWGRHQQAP